MSYGLLNQCWNCKKAKEGCEDAAKIQKAISEIHDSTDGSHKGSGNIVICCTKCESMG